MAGWLFYGLVVYSRLNDWPTGDWLVGWLVGWLACWWATWLVGDCLFALPGADPGQGCRG